MPQMHDPKFWLIILAAFLGYVCGLKSGLDHLWPYPQVKSLKDRLARSPIQFDGFERLVAFPGKQTVPCPAQTPRTAVLFTFGQSNSANHQGQRYVGVDDRVVNFFDGRCYLASSPLLGASGFLGESWTLLGNKLVESGRFDRAIIVSAGIGGSSVADWAADGRLNQLLQHTLDGLQGAYRVTHFLWHQGHADFLQGTSERDYSARFASVLATIRARNVSAPVYVCKNSGSADTSAWVPDNPVRSAQDSLVERKLVFAGPDTDLDVTPADRYDGQHFSASGQEKFVNSWLQILRPPLSSREN